MSNYFHVLKSLESLDSMIEKVNDKKSSQMEHDLILVASFSVRPALEKYLMTDAFESLECNCIVRDGIIKNWLLYFNDAVLSTLYEENKDLIMLGQVWFLL